MPIQKPVGDIAGLVDEWMWENHPGVKRYHRAAGVLGLGGVVCAFFSGSSAFGVVAGICTLVMVIAALISWCAGLIVKQLGGPTRDDTCQVPDGLVARIADERFIDSDLKRRIADELKNHHRVMSIGDLLRIERHYLYEKAANASTHPGYDALMRYSTDYAAQNSGDDQP